MVQRYAHLAPDFIASYAENSARGGAQLEVHKNDIALRLVSSAWIYGVTDGVRTHDNRNHNQIVKYIISNG